MSVSCAIKLVQRVAKTGSAATTRQGRPPGAGKLAPYMAMLIRWVEAQSDISMPEFSAKLEAATKMRAHPASGCWTDRWMAMPSEPMFGTTLLRPSVAVMSWCSTISRRTRWRASARPSPNGAQIFYLPPYSPDMNPIEMAFAKLKALLRQEPARTVDGLVECIGHLLGRFAPTECNNFFNAAGYQRSW